MKQLIQRLLIFILMMVGMYLMMYASFYYLEKHARGEMGRFRYISDSLSADGIIMGSSRALHHYDPKILEDSIHFAFYNCGEDRMGIIYNYGIYLLIKSRHTPKILIYDIEPDYDLLEDDNNTYLDKLRPYVFRQRIIDIFTDVDRTEEFKTLIPFYRFNSRLMPLLKDNAKPDMIYNLGFSPYIGRGKFVYEKMRQDKHDTLKMKYIHKLFDDCRGHTQLVFVASPQLSYQSDSVYVSFAQMCYNENVPFLNHFCDRRYTSHREYFHNANHLNSVGAEIYTQDIAHEIKVVLEKRKIIGNFKHRKTIKTEQ